MLQMRQIKKAFLVELVMHSELSLIFQVIRILAREQSNIKASGFIVEPALCDVQDM